MLAGIVIVPDDVIVCCKVIPALGAGNTEIAIRKSPLR
jgi:hypothetical protein